MTTPTPIRSTEQTTPTTRSRSATAASLWLMFTICLVAVNLRPTLTSLGPLVDSVRDGLGLSGSAMGVLITLPILCFGAFAPLAPQLLRYQSAERIILVGLAVLVLGIGLRSLFGVVGLFAGTTLAGASISVIMVLLPSIIKQHFPRQAGQMMGVYSTALCLGAAVAAGATVPLENIPGSNWRWALAFWLVPAVIATIVWRLQRPASQRQTEQTRVVLPRLRTNLLAWQVTLFMGLQSALAYCVFGWLPVILIDRGMTPLLAGLVLSVSIGVQLISSLSGPWLATRGRDQRATIAFMLSLTLIGLMGCLYGSLSSVWLWAVLLGLGQGGTFSIALALLVLRAPTAQVAASLSGMAQGVGYSIAALGPFIVGLLHEYSGNWHGVAVFFVLTALGSFAFAMYAGQARYISLEPAPANSPGQAG